MSEYTAAELIAHHIETSPRTRKDIAAGSGVSESTLSRIVNSQPVSITTLKTLASYFEIGDEFMALLSKGSRTGCEFADHLCDELDKIRAYYEAKAVNVRTHYEDQIATLREQNARQEAERAREREMQRDTYERTVAYLREDNARLREEDAVLRKDLNEANQSAVALATKKHVVVWILGVLNALALVSLILSLVL